MKWKKKILKLRGLFGKVIFLCKLEKGDAGDICSVIFSSVICVCKSVEREKKGNIFDLFLSTTEESKKKIKVKKRLIMADQH